MRYTRRLVEAGASVDLIGDALADASDSLSKAALACNKAPFQRTDDLEIAVAEHVDWFDHRRLRGEPGLALPVEF